MASALETEYGGVEEVLDAESLWRLSSEKSVSVWERVEPWLFSRATAMQVATNPGEIAKRGEGKREGKYGKIVKSY